MFKRSIYKPTSQKKNCFLSSDLNRSKKVSEYISKIIGELNDLYCSPNIVRVIKSRRMRWAGHVARMGEEGGV